MPKRHDDLFGRIASFAALRAAARKAVRGKRRKPGAGAFYARLESELLRLESELRDGSYRPGTYVEIRVRDPKERLVSAAPFRDRVVHHALCAVIACSSAASSPTALPIASGRERTARLVPMRATATATRMCCAVTSTVIFPPSTMQS
jgi:hypothetical protein